MRACPTCGAACGDEDLFCEADGTHLAPLGAAGRAAGPAVSTSPASGTSGPCDGCSAVGSDDGDGYCSVCGHRLVASPEARGAIAVGTRFGRFVVQSALEGEATAVADDGQEVLLLLRGEKDDENRLHHEAEALTRLASNASSGGGAFPRVIERDPKGVYLALTHPSTAARRLADVLQSAPVERSVAALRASLDLLAAVEAARYSFTPEPRDLLLGPSDAVSLVRLRGARPLAKDGATDTRALVACLADIFLAPAILGPTELVKLLAPNREARPHSLAELRRVVAELESSVHSPKPRTSMAELCDPGLWRPYNQDATAMDHGSTISGDPFVVLVVCDGVSSSAYSDRASRTAARVARDALAHFARSPDVDHETAGAAVSSAIRASHLAVCAGHVADPVQEPPGTTIVAAFVHKRRLTVGWVGDSRVYWLTPRGAELLTHDHSWVNEAIARGEVKDADEVQGALAHTITRCLGPLEVGDVPVEIEPDVRTRDLAGAGLVVLCTDGLWNYAPKASDLATIIRGARDESDAGEIARLLVNYALARGGQDNVSVAVYAHP